MRKRIKGKMQKAISILLCAVMVFGLTPDFGMTVYANEEGGSVQEEGNTKTENVDFSDAKVLTSVDGMLYIDGVEAESLNTSGTNRKLPAGKYKLNGDITTSYYILVNEGDEVSIDLNGYTWDMSNCDLILCGSVSIYDTSGGETGKLISTRDVLWMNYQNSSVFNLYGGTIETTGTTCAVNGQGIANLYGGEIKSSGDTISYVTTNETRINLDGTVLACGEGYAHFKVAIPSDKNISIIDVADYIGDSLIVRVDVTAFLETGNIKLFEGIKNAEEAEKYIVNFSSEYNSCYLEKTEYDETTGEMYLYVVKNAFTQQPTVDNNYTVGFNHPEAVFQWYEVEETVLTDENVAEASATFENGKWIVDSEYVSVFSYGAKAGDRLRVSTNSDIEYVYIDVDSDYICLDQCNKSAMINITSDTTVDVMVTSMEAESQVELEFTLIRERAVDGETEKTLHVAEHKSYRCKVTVGTNTYDSDTICCDVVIGTKDYTPVYSARQNTITETCSLCNAKMGEIYLNTPTTLTYDGTEKKATIDGTIEGVDISNVVYKKGEEILTGAPVDPGTYTASITLGEATASVTFEILKGDMEVSASGYKGTYDKAPHSITVNAPEGATIEYKYGADGKWSATNPVFTDVGTYEVEYRVSKANYNTITGKATVTIKIADMEVSASGYTGTYDKASHSITVNAPEGATIEYKYGADGKWSLTNPVFTDAGTYEVEYRVSKANYNTVTGKAVVTINLAEMKVTAKGYTGTEDKASHSITVTAPKGAKVEYRLSKKDSWSTKNPAFKAPSEKAITVYYRVTLANYKTVEGSAKVHVKFNLKKGAAFTINKYKYKITGSSTVTFTGITSSSIKKVTIPKTVKYGGKTFKVTAIASKALKGKTKVTDITIGSNVTSIGSSAFAGCTKLTTVKIGSKVKTIGKSAFEGCKKLTKVTIGSAVTTIDDKAFKNCVALKSITIPSKVTKIDTQAFYGCKNLKSITIKTTKLKTVGKNALKGINAKAKIKVPSSKLKAYKTLLKSKGQGSKVKIERIK